MPKPPYAHTSYINIHTYNTQLLLCTHEFFFFFKPTLTEFDNLSVVRLSLGRLIWDFLNSVHRSTDIWLLNALYILILPEHWWIPNILSLGLYHHWSCMFFVCSSISCICVSLSHSLCESHLFLSIYEQCHAFLWLLFINFALFVPARYNLVLTNFFFLYQVIIQHPTIIWFNNNVSFFAPHFVCYC